MCLHVLMCQKRQDGSYLLKIGIDGGGGSFKVCLNIIDQVSPGQSSVKKQQNIGGSTTQFSNAGVKKLFIQTIAMMFKNIMKMVKPLLMYCKFLVYNLVFLLIKLANILIRLQSHGSKYLCTLCEGTVHGNLLQD